ncbi:MAG: hypothetical protein A2Y12_16425 [Planctomycetes bacterium GWF2_42_9]|nr:MAG: hypothetical protein A2Y12_16425 [Planctomycetes bacterium GWF2_42_9]
MDTGGVSNPGSGGNRGGYLSIGDKSSATSIVLTPATFLGDWSSLDNNGYLTVDLRIASRSGIAATQEFIRITGPNGSAYVTIEPNELPQSNLEWKTFKYPISSAVWTMDWGTWYDLLSEVTECEITAEFYSSTETIGLDNFGRMSSNCGAIDDTVSVNDVNIVNCGYISMVGISTVAHNPKDDELYGLVRTIASSGGGLYKVSGTGVGIKMQSYENPAHLLFDKSGNAFVSEDYSGNIYRKSWGGMSNLWVSGLHSGDDDPYGMAFAPFGFDGTNVSEGDIIVADCGASGADEIWTFSSEAAENEKRLIPDTGNVDWYDLTADPNGKVYVCDSLNASNLFEVQAGGTLTALHLSTSINSINSIVYDNVTNDIYISSNITKTIYRVNPATGQVLSVLSGFNNLHPCCLEIAPAKRRLWVADNGYNRVYEFCLSGGAAVDISVGLEGSVRPAPDGWRIPLHIGFFKAGADVSKDSTLYYCLLTTDKDGDNAVCQVPGIGEGTYDITMVSEHTLLNVKRNVIITESNTAVDMGVLSEGNADGDWENDFIDFTILASAWQEHKGEASYDSRADFDRNNAVDICDLSLLCLHWLEVSPIEIP